MIKLLFLKLLIVGFLCIHSYNVNSQSVYYVIDKSSKKPINGAKVSISGGDYRTIGLTNVDGEISLASRTKYYLLSKDYESYFTTDPSQSIIEISKSNVPISRYATDYDYGESGIVRYYTDYRTSSGSLASINQYDLKSEYYKNLWDKQTFIIDVNNKNEIIGKWRCIYGDCLHSNSTFYYGGYIWHGDFYNGLAIGEITLSIDPRYQVHLFYPQNIYPSKLDWYNFKKPYISWDKTKVIKFFECGCLSGDCYNGYGTYQDWKRLIKNGKFLNGKYQDNTGEIIEDEYYKQADNNFTNRYNASINSKPLKLSEEDVLLNVAQKLIEYNTIKSVASKVNKKIATSICPNTAKDGVYTVLSIEDKGNYILIDLKNQWTGAACMSRIACPWETYYTKEKVYITKPNYEIGKIENYYKSPNVSQVWSTSDVVAGLAVLATGAAILSSGDDSKKSSSYTTPSSGSSSYSSGSNSSGSSTSSGTNSSSSSGSSGSYNSSFSSQNQSVTRPCYTVEENKYKNLLSTSVPYIKVKCGKYNNIEEFVYVTKEQGKYYNKDRFLTTQGITQTGYYKYSPSLSGDVYRFKGEDLEKAIKKECYCGDY